ncbi:MAG: ATP-binding protein [Bacteroidota bacterium]
MRKDQALEDSIFKVGKVISIDGRVVEIRVDKAKNASHLLYRGELLKNVSVGGYVKIVKGFTRLIGKIDGEFMSADRYSSRRGYTNEKDKINRILRVSLLGFFDGDSFKRGIKEMPLIENECFLLHNQEFSQVHNFIQPDDEPFQIGTLAFEKGQKIEVGVNGLFASHIGIFGNTGSGKSYTLAKIYRDLFEKYKDEPRFKSQLKFFILDFNGEYVDEEDNIIVDKDRKNIYKLSTRDDDGSKYPVTAETLEVPDIWTVLLEATQKTQAPFLRRALANETITSAAADGEQLKTMIVNLITEALTKGERDLDRAVVLSMLKELNACLANPGLENLRNDYRVHLKFHTRDWKFYYEDASVKHWPTDNDFRSLVVDAKTGPITISTERISPFDSIRLRILLQYYDDIIRGFANKEHLGPLIGRMDKRIDDLKKVMEVRSPSQAELERCITVVSLRDVNIHMRKILPLLLCQKLYRDKRDEADNDKYLNIVIDEAHNILSEDSERESEQWKDYRLETFEEIIKEGRKFGAFLTIASQRPSDISPTIISQLHHYFLHRLINNDDIKAVERTVSFLDRVSFESLPILPTGTCIFAGLQANVPVVIDIGRIEPRMYEPRNKTLELTKVIAPRKPALAPNRPPR